MPRIVWAEQALTDVREIVSYIRRDRVEAAANAGRRIRESTRRLAEFPLSGRLVPELPDHEFRELIVGPYRVIYEYRDDQVEILTVVHGRRDLNSLFSTGE